WKPSGLFWAKRSRLPLRGTSSLIRCVATERKAPQPPAGPEYGTIDTSPTACAACAAVPLSNNESATTDVSPAMNSLRFMLHLEREQDGKPPFGDLKMVVM